jgi:hypothetical protein
MARRRKQQAHVTLSAAGAKQPKRVVTGLIISVVIALILGGIPFGLGKYIELNSPGPYDSGAYVYSAQHLLKGAQMGVDEVPSARPGTLIANIIGVKLFGFNDTGPKAVQMILQMTALIFMFITLRRLFGPVASVVCTTVGALYLSAPVISKFGNVKEQFMIAFMIYAACAFIWYSVTQKNVWLMLSGFFALQPYYFKPTGMSVVLAIILYVLFSNAIARKWKLLWNQLGLFLCGYSLGMVIPGSLYAWQGIIPQLLKSFPPLAITLGAGILILSGIPIIIHTFAEKKENATINKIPQWIWGVAIVCALLVLIVLQWDRIVAAAGLKGAGYLSRSKTARSFSTLAPQIFRYYKALSVPMLLALISVLTTAIVWIRAGIKKVMPDAIQTKIVWMLAVWWLLDTLFVWISPRSYEQYYLPLCASGAMLGGFIIWKWQGQLSLSANKMPLLAVGMATVLALGCLSIPILIGQQYSPDTGADYVKNYGHRRRGFGPALKELPSRKQGAWVAVGEHIRTHSNEDDTMYVWGWMPGIYVQAQRLAPVSKAFEGDMHVKSPPLLKRQIDRIVRQMTDTPPKFIVDSRKRHFPNDRPPLELWPIVPPKMFSNEKPRFLKNIPQEVAAFDTAWSNFLESQIEPDEAKRYEALKPFRDFVMNNYQIVGQYGNHILFEKK